MPKQSVAGEWSQRVTTSAHRHRRENPHRHETLSGVRPEVNAASMKRSMVM
ncbi:hypothetical protein NPIL_616091, partial [Nephila pilipes]